MITCPACKEKIKKEDWENESRYSNILGEDICGYCVEKDEERPSTLVKYSPAGKEVINWGDYLAWAEDGGNPPDWFWDYFTKREWHSTDAWRGFYETKFKNGFVKLADGWVTGFPDASISHKQKTYDLYDLLEKDPIPAPLYWLYESTSNLFSMACEVFCDEEDKPVLEEWLRDHQITLEELEEAFS